MALLIVAAMGHCAWEWQAVLGQAAQMASYRNRSESLPILPDRGCHNETGCLCRGALSVTAVNVAHCSPTASGLLPLTIDDTPARTTVSVQPAVPAACEALTDFYGRSLRARLGSLLL